MLTNLKIIKTRHKLQWPITFLILIPRMWLKMHQIAPSLLYPLHLEPYSGDQYQESYGPLKFMMRFNIFEAYQHGEIMW